MNAENTKKPVTRKRAAATPPTAPVAEAPVESPEDMRARIEAELREKVEAEIRAKVEAEQEEADRAQAMANEATPVNGLDITDKPGDNSLMVNFVEDGLTILGKVWYRGEELAINPGTPQWEEAHAILSLDEFQQEERWGRRFFRPGPWRGRRLDEIDDEALTDAERKQLKKAEQKRRERLGL